MAEDEFEVPELKTDEVEKTVEKVTVEPPKVAEYPRDFYIKEYEALRKEIDWMLPDSRAVERNVVIAIGLSWAFLVKVDGLPKFAWWVPFLFAVLGTVRSIALAKKFEQIGNYILSIERYFTKGQKKNGGPLGWETFQELPANRRSFVRGSGLVFWAILMLVTAGVAVWYNFYAPPLVHCKVTI